MGAGFWGRAHPGDVHTHGQDEGLLELIQPQKKMSRTWEMVPKDGAGMSIPKPGLWMGLGLGCCPGYVPSSVLK